MEHKDVVSEVMEEVAGYVRRRFSATAEDVKLVRYPGGDYFVFGSLNRIFMYAPNARVFVEVFGGSCWCSLSVSRSKFKIVVCNDIDRDLINLYRMIKSNPEELIRRLSVLPYSREMLEIAREVLSSKSADAVTKAAMMFYLLRATFNAKVESTSLSVSKEYNHAIKYSKAIASLVDYAKRFRDVILEAKDYREVIRMYDSDHTLFYLDPPYVGEGRNYYRFPFTESSLKTMATVLKDVKGYWVLKIAEDNYRIIKDVLPEHSTARIEVPHYMVKVRGEERPKYEYIVAFNYATNLPNR